MPDYYRGPAVRITHKVFVSRSPVAVSYVISELRGVHVVVCERSARPTVSRTVLGSGAALAAITAMGAGVRPIIALGFVFAAATLIGAGCVPSRTPIFELRARYRESDVCLFRTSDAREFGQVSRAMMRALEAGS